MDGLGVRGDERGGRVGKGWGSGEREFDGEMCEWGKGGKIS